MYELAWVLMSVAVITTILSLLSIIFEKHDYVPWLISFTIVLYIASIISMQLYDHNRAKYCTNKQAVYLKDQDACFKLIEVK